MLFRCAASLTQTRLDRLEVLLKKKRSQLDPIEWAIARELMNRTDPTFRNYLNGMAGEWMEAMQGTVSRDELNASLVSSTSSSTTRSAPSRSAAIASRIAASSSPCSRRAVSRNSVAGDLRGATHFQPELDQLRRWLLSRTQHDH